MTEPAISVRHLSKRYRLGTISRFSLVDEVQYWWHRLRGRNPLDHFGKIGHTAREQRKVDTERDGAKEFWALRDVSFDVQPGEVVGVIGCNGAGKSTLLKLLTRITEPTSGEAFINGRVASLLEVGTGFHPELTGRENVYMNGTILGMRKREIDSKFDEIVAFSELGDFIDTPVKRYSSGMYVRLAFAVAAHLEPEILLVDEVLAVGDAAFQEKCLGKMKDVTSEGRTVLFVSHNMVAVKSLCTRGIYLKHGAIALAGTAEEVVTRYLGDVLHVSRHVDISERKDRRGTGIVRATRAGLAFDKNRGAWVLQVGYTSNLPTWSDASLRFSIRRVSGEIVTFLDSSCVPGLPKHWPASGTVVVGLTPDFRLHPGEFLCNIACVSGREVVDHVTDALTLQVTDPEPFDWRKLPANAGTCFLRQTWTVRGA